MLQPLQRRVDGIQVEAAVENREEEFALEDAGKHFHWTAAVAAVAAAAGGMRKYSAQK